MCISKEILEQKMMASNLCSAYDILGISTGIAVISIGVLLERILI